MGGAIFDTVQTPFIASHGGSYQNSSVSTAYNISFGSSSFDFQATTLLAAQGSPPIFTSAWTGYVHFSSDMPLLLSIDAQLSYSLPPGDREAYMRILAGDGTHVLFDKDGYAAPVFGDPPVGVFTAHADSILIPPGAGSGFSYTFSLDSYSGNPAVLSHGDGMLHVHVETIPEPTTSALLALATITLARRRSSKRL